MFVTNIKFLLLLKICVLQENSYSVVQFMNTEEENNWQEEMTIPTPKVNFVVKLNSDVLKNLCSLQAKLKSFREDSINEIKEK